MPGRPLTRQSRRIIADLENDPDWLVGTFDRLASGDPLDEVAGEYAILPSVLVRWFAEDEGRWAEYLRALEIAADVQMHRAIPIADGVAEDKTAIAKARLRIDVRQRLAGSWNQPRYGERLQITKDARVSLSEDEIRGQLAELLARNPDVKRAILTLDGEYAQVLDELPALTVTDQREALPADHAADHADNAQQPRTIAAAPELPAAARPRADSSSDDGSSPAPAATRTRTKRQRARAAAFDPTEASAGSVTGSAALEAPMTPPGGWL